MRIWLNGYATHGIPEELSYEKLVELAFPKYRARELPIMTVTYSTPRRGDSERSGTLIPGQTVKVEDGMIFNVADTSNA